MRNHQRISKLLVVCGVVLFSAPVMADSSNFMVESFTGATLQHGVIHQGVGLESGILFGVGGTLYNFPPVFLLYFRGSYSFFGNETITNSDYTTSHVRRDYSRLAGGLRVVIPVIYSLRIILDVGGGKIFTYEQNKQDGSFTGSYENSLGILELGAGLNYQLLRWLSVGILANYAIVVDGGHNHSNGLYFDSANPNWASLTATLGFQF